MAAIKEHAACVVMTYFAIFRRCLRALVVTESVVEIATLVLAHYRDRGALSDVVISDTHRALTLISQEQGFLHFCVLLLEDLE